MGCSASRKKNMTFLEKSFFKHMKPPHNLKYQSNWQHVFHFNIMTGTKLKLISLDIWKVKQSRNRPGMAQKVPGGLGSQIFMTFSTWRWWGYQPHASAAFTPRKCSWNSFSLEAELTPRPWCGRKKICHWKIQWHHRELIPGPFD